MINTLGKTVAQRRWTQTAIECYERGCSCEGCILKDVFDNSEYKCQMKAAVLELVRKFGLPDNVESKGILK